MRTWSLALTIVLFAAPSAWAADRAVPGDFKTIQAAVDASSPGDRVLVSPGSYNESVTVTKARLSIVGRGATWESVKAGVLGTCVLVQADGVQLQGFAFRACATAVAVQGNGLGVTKCTASPRRGKFVSGTGNDCLVTGCKVFGGSLGVDIKGDRAVTTRCAFVQTNQPVHVVGAEANVVSNSIANSGGGAIYVDGAFAIVRANSISNAGGSAIELPTADSAVVDHNFVAGATGFGLHVRGREWVVRRNTVSRIGSDFEAYALDAPVVAESGASGPCLVDHNTATDCQYIGFGIRGDGTIVSSNRAIRCGTYYESGFSIGGDDHPVAGNVAVDCARHGFEIYGNRAALVSNIAQTCGSNGFNVDGGADVSLTGCTATACGGAGFNNGGTGTRVLNSTFSANRVDVSADIAGGATWAAFSANSFTTGGQTTQSDID